MGTNKIDTLNVLVNAGACLDYLSCGGGSLLTSASSSEDSDPVVLRLVLKKLEALCKGKDTARFRAFINYRQRPQSLKWKTISVLANVLYRTGLVKSSFITAAVMIPGATSLNQAVIRGDIEIVKILLDHGADPYIENDVGMNAFDVCERFGPFPRISALLERYDGKKW